MMQRVIVAENLSPLEAGERFDGLSLREARTKFFAEQGIAADGGYEDKVVPVWFGPSM
jgi:hypothetical protein